MTPEQCHANHYHSQQVEGSAGWDRHSSGDLRNRQMDGQDEENRRIYNQRDFTKKGGKFGRRQEVLSMEYQKRRRRNHPRPRTEDELWPSPQPRCRQSSSPTIPPNRWRCSHKGPVLKSASLPNSLYWACWVWVYSHLQWKEPPKSRPYKYKFPLPHFVFHFIFHQLQLVMCLFFSILNFIYFIRKVKQIHNKS